MVALLAGGPLLATAVLALGALFDACGLARALAQDPQWLRCLGLRCGPASRPPRSPGGAPPRCCSRRASFGNHWAPSLRSLPVMLATPHAAFAIGLAFLLAPSGWLLRALSPWLTGFDFPPPWPTTQDPWGLGLIAGADREGIPACSGPPPPSCSATTCASAGAPSTRWRRRWATARSARTGAWSGRSSAPACSGLCSRCWPMASRAGGHGAGHRPRLAAHAGGAGLAVAAGPRPCHQRAGGGSGRRVGDGRAGVCAGLERAASLGGAPRTTGQRRARRPAPSSPGRKQGQGQGPAPCLTPSPPGERAGVRARAPTACR